MMPDSALKVACPAGPQAVERRTAQMARARPRGKHAYSFFDRESGTALRLCLRVSKNEQASREEWQQMLMDMPLEAMFSASAPEYEVPEIPRIFASVPCELCGEAVAEPMLRLDGGKKVCLDCHRHYARRW